MLNWALRYVPVAALAESSPGPILDVGSGPHGLARYLRRPDIVAVDQSFSDEAPDGGARQVVASALDLPFEDASFDTTVCVDMLEHVAPAHRAPAVRELARVTRSMLILAFPCGEVAAAHDLDLASFFRRRGRDLEWLAEHEEHGYPSVEDMVAAAAPRAELVDRRGNANVAVHRWVTILDNNPFTRAPMRWLERPILLRALGPWLDSEPTYRQILVFRPRNRGATEPSRASAEALA